MKMFVVMLLLSFGVSASAQQQEMREYVHQLASRVIALENEVKALAATSEDEKRRARENYDQLRVYLLDFVCKYTKLAEQVSAGTHARPVFPVPLELIQGKACGSNNPSPILKGSY